MKLIPTINTRTVGREFHQFFFDEDSRPRHAGEWHHIGGWDDKGRLALRIPLIDTLGLTGSDLEYAEGWNACARRFGTGEDK